MKISTLVAAVVAAAGLGAPGASAKTAITHETLWMMKRVGSPVATRSGALKAR